MYRKKQTTIHTNGFVKTGVVQVGIAATNLDGDKERERAYFSKIATDPRIQNRIQTVELAGDSLVVVYESGMIKVIQWVAD